MEIWIISFVSLWILVVAMMVYLVILTRQVGILHMRLRPAGARITSIGPEIGGRLPTLQAEDIFGNVTSIVGGRRARIVVFVSPSCIACQELLPGLKVFAKEESGDVEVIIITGMEDPKANHGFVEKHGLGNIPYVASASITREYGISTTPYGIAVDRDGIVQSKGIVNQIEHLESLVNVLLDKGTDLYGAAKTPGEDMKGEGNSALS